MGILALNETFSPQLSLLSLLSFRASLWTLVIASFPTSGTKLSYLSLNFVFHGQPWPVSSIRLFCLLFLSASSHNLFRCSSPHYKLPFSLQHPCLLQKASSVIEYPTMNTLWLMQSHIDPHVCASHHMIMCICQGKLNHWLLTASDSYKHPQCLFCPCWMITF